MTLKLILLIALSSGRFDLQGGADLFALFLEKYVNESGYVDYDSIHHEYDFQPILNYISNIDVWTMSENERLAFYINSYNILVIKNVIDHWPLDSPMDVPGFFKKFRFAASGEKLSLDDLEYKKIFPLEDVLVHFGLVCAAESCPRLMNVAYQGSTVRDQLIERGRIFLQDPDKNRLDMSADTLYLSEIFRWFRGNFEKRYGTISAAAQHFLSREDSLYIARNKISIAFIKYDWKLNRQKK
jgi:hypothetical protein